MTGCLLDAVTWPQHHSMPNPLHLGICAWKINLESGGSHCQISSWWQGGLQLCTLQYSTEAVRVKINLHLVRTEVE